MSDAFSVISPVVELFGWFGFIVGTPFLLAGWVLRRRATRLESTVGVVIPPPDWARAATARWMDVDGQLHETQFGDVPVTTPLETELTVHYDPDRPHRARVHPPHDDGRASRTVGFVLYAVGAVCAVASVALLFVS